MKRIVFILLTNLLLVEGRKLSIWQDEKERKSDLDERERRMPQYCRSNDDCGQSGCCFELTHECFPLKGEKEACLPESCPCKPGLSCTPIGKYPGQSFYQCLKPKIQHDPANMA